MVILERFPVFLFRIKYQYLMHRNALMFQFIDQFYKFCPRLIGRNNDVYFLHVFSFYLLPVIMSIL